MPEGTSPSAMAASPRKAQLSARAVGRVKPFLFLLGLAPFLRWIWLGFNNGLTANPVEFLTRSSGTWTLVCLLVTLAITPLRRLTGSRRWSACAGCAGYSRFSTGPCISWPGSGGTGGWIRRRCCRTSANGPSSRWGSQPSC